MNKLLIFLASTCLAFAVAKGHYKFTPLKELEYNKELALIGKRLYFDINLNPQKNSCNSCHDLNITGSGSSKSGINSDGEINPPTVLNIAHSGVFFHDGVIRFLRDQVAKTLVRQPGTDKEFVENAVKNNKDYIKAFAKINRKPTFEAVVDALTEFEKALTTLDAPIDKYLAGDYNAISPKAQAGFRLFNYFGCTSCHNGSNFGAGIISKTDDVMPDCNISKKKSFKVPTLRNIATTAPYGSMGEFLHLEDMVRAMIVCQTSTMPQDEQVDAIIEFLKTLTGKKPRILDE